MIRNVIYDFDGTIADTETFYAESFCKTMEGYGVICDEQDRLSFRGLGPHEKIRLICDKYNVNIDHEGATFRYRKYNYEHFPEPKSILFEDVEPSLRYCKSKGYQIYICSNTDSYRVKEILEQMEIDHYFDGISGKDLCKARKPSSIPYFYILEHFNISKDETIAIEDSIGGVESALGAGIRTIGLQRDKGVTLPTDTCIDTLFDLNELI